MEQEIQQISANNLWAQVYYQIRRESMNHDFTTIEASKPENRALNRYRDVYPYDHSRVVLQDNDDTDYINASLVSIPRANRKYILAQGPLPCTVGHFWLLVWQQQSRAVLMLNRVMEKGQLKCHQYWPVNEGETMEFPDVNLRLEHVSSVPGHHYTVRTLRLTDVQRDESRDILHFHYTTWPDFGVPKCPDTFLEFLLAVRNSGSLDEDGGPPLIHCSAGVGRSGTFCLVDTCLVLLEREGPDAVIVKDILLEMRNFRMGLIQTPDQLKFSYLAIAEGARQKGIISSKLISDLSTPPMSDSSTDDDSPPPMPPPRTESLKNTDLAFLIDTFSSIQNRLVESHEAAVNGNGGHSSTPPSSSPDSDAGNPAGNPGPRPLPSVPSEEATEDIKTDSSPTKCILKNDKMEERKREMELRRRKKEEERTAMETRLKDMKQRAKEAEAWERKKQSFLETLVPFGVGLAMLFIGTYYYWKS